MNGVLLINRPWRCQLVTLELDTGEEVPSVWFPITKLRWLENLARRLQRRYPNLVCQINQQ